MTITALITALKTTAKAATEHSDKASKAIRANTTSPGAYHAFYYSTEAQELRNASVVQIGRVTVIANVGGNSRRQHVRHTFKIDGKRASRAEAEALLA